MLSTKGKKTPELMWTKLVFTVNVSDDNLNFIAMWLSNKSFCSGYDSLYMQPYDMNAN